MQVTLTIPDDLAAQLIAAGKDPAQAALEALAVEGYRSQRLSEYDIRRMLGFETRMEVHGFLKEHGAYLHYSVADMEHDDDTARRLHARSMRHPAEPASKTK
jgi:Uncharacterised protein family (UPF0175)